MCGCGRIYVVSSVMNGVRDTVETYWHNGRGGKECGGREVHIALSPGSSQLTM